MDLRSSTNSMAWSTRSSVRWYPSPADRGGWTGVVVVGEFRVELIGGARQESVEAVESPLHRPVVVGTGGRDFRVRVEMPLAECEGGEAFLAQHLRQGCGVGADSALLIRETLVREIGDRRNADGVVVAARQQGRPGRGTQRCDVEIVVAQAVRRQRIHVGCRDRRSIAAQVAESRVVQEDHQDVGDVTRRCGRPPVGL